MNYLLRAVGALTVVLCVFAASASAGSGVDSASDTAIFAKGTGDDFRSPESKRYDAALQQGLQAKLEGKAKGKVHRVANGQYVQLERTGTDRIFVILVEFGNERYPNPLFADDAKDAAGKPLSTAKVFDGPLRNSIPQPNRAVDNSTLWQADFNQPHYQDMYFNRMARYYERQSSNRYSVAGDVTAWVKVPFNEALYGRNYCGSIVCPTSRALVRDALAVWVQQQLDSGKTLAEITAYLKTFDNQDRYDIDGDGNFNEPDGFIDHFQIVHAGGDEAASDPRQGTDAIWSHRSFANLQAGGPGGLAGVNVGSRGGLVSSALIPNNPTGHLGPRLHHAAGERRPRGLRARVRPRPRSARPVRHVRQHGRRREQHDVLDPDVVGREHRRRRPERDRRRADRHGRVGEVPARLAGRPRRSAGPVLRGRELRREVAAQARAERRRDEAGPGADRAAAGQGSEQLRHGSEDGYLLLLVGPRRQPQQHVDQGVPDPGGRHADCRPLVRHRAALRLLLHRDVVRQRHDVDSDQDEPVGAGLGGPRRLQRQRHRHRGLERRRLQVAHVDLAAPVGQRPRPPALRDGRRTPAERVSRSTTSRSPATRSTAARPTRRRMRGRTQASPG